MTRHELPKGPGWVQPAPEYRDDLDKIISGFKEKTIADDYDVRFRMTDIVALTFRVMIHTRSLMKSLRR